jgi:hypothetical protein
MGQPEAEIQVSLAPEPTPLAPSSSPPRRDPSFTAVLSSSSSAKLAR